MRFSERLQRFRHPMSLLLAVTVVPVVILGKYGDRLLNLEIPKRYVEVSRSEFRG